jgi:hypothetical protein
MGMHVHVVELALSEYILCLERHVVRESYTYLSASGERIPIHMQTQDWIENILVHLY